MAIHTLENGQLKVVINETGGTIDAFTYSNQSPFDILRPRLVDSTNFAGNSSSFPMLPMVNRIRGNQFTWQDRHIILPVNEAIDADFFLHGNGWLTQWRCKTPPLTASTRSLSTNTMLPHEPSLTLTMQSHIPDVCRYTAEQYFQLTHSGLTITLRLTNTGQQPFPFGLGFHPFFHCLPDTLVQFSAEGMWLEGTDYLPTDYMTPIPDAFNFSHQKPIPSMWMNNGYKVHEGGIKIRLQHPNGLSIQMVSPCQYLQAYKPEGDSDFLCLEPQSQHVNAHHCAHHDSLTILKPDESMSITMSITIQLTATD
ncbi:aldose 1-epimerase [Photobacterium nomapromontoriensis]|uniref:aldose 1-epimerase n=1 Tax=Photobacterium nomapromontoriensis TaxID=2910237 RepID=UPI003D0FA5E2